MWEAQSHIDPNADQKAAEAGLKRLQALEFELRGEEERRQQEWARLRAEELKKRIQESERTRGGEAEKTVRSTSRLPSETAFSSNTESGQIYLEVLLLAHRDGALGKTEEGILALLRQRLGITDKEHLRLQQKVRMEIYSQAIVEVWEDGIVTKQESDRLDLLRDQLNISAEDHMRLERIVRKQALMRQAAVAS